MVARLLADAHVCVLALIALSSLSIFARGSIDVGYFVRRIVALGTSCHHGNGNFMVQGSALFLAAHHYSKLASSHAALCDFLALQFLLGLIMELFISGSSSHST